MSIRRGVLVALLVSLASLVAVAGCGKEAGRVTLIGEGSGAVELPLQEGDVAFWTDIDIAYEGDAALTYKIELFQNGSAAGTASCNPLGNLPSKANWVETNIGAKHTRRGNGKMECSTSLSKGGPTMVKTTLAFSKKPTTLTFKKADLVIKQ